MVHISDISRLAENVQLHLGETMDFPTLLNALNDNILIVLLILGVFLLFIPISDNAGGKVTALQKLGEVLIRLISLSIGTITDAGTSTIQKLFLTLLFLLIISFFFIVIPYALIIGIQLNPEDPTLATIGPWTLHTLLFGMSDIGSKLGAMIRQIIPYLLSLFGL